MKKYLRYAAFALAVAFLVLTVTNASWMAAEPKGAVKLVAHRGLAQIVPRDGVDEEGCTAAQIEEPYHPYLENTVEGAVRAFKLGTQMVEVDIAPTADGEIVLFGDRALDCRTDGTGPVSEKTLEELKALDIGYGYTADGGETFPFRGKGVGKMPEIGELLGRLKHRERLMFNFSSSDPAEADLLAEKLAEAGRDPVKKRDAFYGEPQAVARIREIYPDAWAWSREEAEQCSRDYILYGWSSYLPQSCRGRTMIIPLDNQFAFWGWPNRLVSRMEEHGGEIIVTAPYESGQPIAGITLPEQFGEVPASFNGYLWVDDAFALTPALYPSRDTRNQEEIDAAWEAMKQRRAAQ